MQKHLATKNPGKKGDWPFERGWRIEGRGWRVERVVEFFSCLHLLRSACLRCKNHYLFCKGNYLQRWICTLT